MKTLKLAVLASAMFLAGPVTVKAQTADEIVEKHLTAIGGKDNWKKINSVKMVGSMNANGMEIGLTSIAVNKKAMRQDIDVAGMNGYSIITSDAGWMYFPWMGQSKAEAMTPDQVKESQDQLNIQGELVDYKENGCKVEYLGKDDVEGTECHKMKFTSKEGNEKTMYFDASNYYKIREVQKIKADGKEMENIITFSNYQKQPEGVVIPMTMGTQGGEMAFKSVEINKPVDESLFKPAN